jgi:hypothetical protein
MRDKILDAGAKCRSRRWFTDLLSAGGVSRHLNEPCGGQRHMIPPCSLVGSTPRIPLLLGLLTLKRLGNLRSELTRRRDRSRYTKRKHQA